MTCENLSSFIVFEVALTTSHGDTRAVMWLARCLLDCAVLKQYSEKDLELLFFLQVGVPTELGQRRQTKWCDLAGLYGAGPIAQKLSKLTGWPHERVHVCKALQELGVRTDKTAFLKRSRLVDGSLVRVLPSALEDEISDAGASEGSAASGPGPQGMTALLKQTALARAAHAPSDASFRRGESLLTTWQDGHGVRRRRKIGSELLSSVDVSSIALMRHEYCRNELRLWN